MNKILYFGSTFCGPCKTVDSNLEPIRNQINLQYINCQIDIETPANYNVRATPTLIFLRPDGYEYKRLVGISTTNEILKWYNY